MNGKSSIRHLMGIFFAAALSGCASTGGIITSLEDLSTESVKVGFIKIPQYRVASIPGWLPFSDVGGLYFYKPSRKPASVIGLSPGHSFELVSKIDSECNQKCLADIRDHITTLGTRAQTLVQTRVDLSVLLAKQPANASDATNQAIVDKANEEYKKAQKDFNESYETVVKSIQSSGVLIYRWAIDSTQSGSLGLDSLLGASVKENQKYNGYALVSGIRTKTLFVGDDLLGAWEQLNKKSRFNNRFELTTHIMQAKYIMYGNISDVSMYAQAKIDASYQQLANSADTIKALTNIEISMALSKVANLSNIGVMGKMTRTAPLIKWDEDALRKRLSADDWLTFYSVESDFTDLIELLDHTKSAK
jgi:hypothetical protein